MTRFTWQELQDAIVDHDAPLGSGSYGTVYRGRLRGGIQVAIKVLNPDSQQGQTEFDREVAILGGLHHDHLLPLLGSCSEQHALVYPLMEGSLEQRLQLAVTASAEASPTAAQTGSASSRAEPLSWLERVRICNEIVQGLIWMHTQEPPILHMDMKTANVLLDKFGTAKVGDVGLAKLKSGTVDTASYIKSSVLRGTPAYMAPEYFQRGECGCFTDVYALGVIVCELLTGKSARDASSALAEVFEDTSTANAEQASAALQPLLDCAACWPLATAVEFAGMAAACLQPRSRLRPDLQRDLQPAMERMLAATTATAAAPSSASVQHTRCAGPQQVVAERQALPATSCDQGSSLMMFVKCPICYDTLVDPVSTPRGITFCRPCITSWLDSHNICPSTRQPLAVQQLVPNYALAGLLTKITGLQQQQQQLTAAPQELHHKQQQHQRGLDLSWNSIADAGVATLPQHAVQHWSSLQSMNSFDNDIGDAGATPVMDTTNRRAARPPSSLLLSPAVPAASPAAGWGFLSPMVQHGRVFSRLYYKANQWNQPIYNMLISEGFKPDLVKCIMLAPPDEAASAAATAGRGSLSPMVQQGKVFSRLTYKADQWNQPIYNTLISAGPLGKPDRVKCIMLAPPDAQ